MSATSARIRLASLLAGEAIAVAALHRSGTALAVDWAAPAAWLGTTPADTVVAAALRYAGLAVGWWLLAGTVAYLLARLSRLPAATAATARLVVPAARRTVDRAIAAGATASILLTAAPALAAPVVPPPVGRPPVVVPADGPAAHPAEGPAATDPALGALPVVGPPAPGAVPSAGPEGAQAEDPAGHPDRHVVAAGEHLWGIAEATVAQAARQDPADVPLADVTAYWLRLVDANRGALRSGDPDLIHPGERLTLPPVTGG